MYYTRLMPSFKLEYILDQLQLGQTTGSSNQFRVLPQNLCWHTALSGRSTQLLIPDSGSLRQMTCFIAILMR
jgi:hypothetical protein